MRKSAFSLIELSIVLIIIGILIAGVMKGGSLVTSARLASARSVTSKSPVPNIDGLTAWYETSLLTSVKEGEGFNGAQTTQWYDISPSSIVQKRNTLSKAPSTDVVYKSKGINKIPSLNFSGSGALTLANFYQGGSAQGTVILVFQPSPYFSGSRKTLFDSYAGQATFSVAIDSANVYLSAGNSTNAVYNNRFVQSSNYILVSSFNNSASEVYVNHALAALGTNLNSGTNSLSGFTLGNNGNIGGSGFDGLISEVIIFNRPLKLQERKDVMNYLSKKYQIAVGGL